MVDWLRVTGDVVGFGVGTAMIWALPGKWKMAGLIPIGVAAFDFYTQVVPQIFPGKHAKILEFTIEKRGPPWNDISVFTMVLNNGTETLNDVIVGTEFTTIPGDYLNPTMQTNPFTLKTWSLFCWGCRYNVYGNMLLSNLSSGMPYNVTAAIVLGFGGPRLDEKTIENAFTA
jgi:hypothetical protein